MINYEVRNHASLVDQRSFYQIFESEGRTAQRKERIHPIPLGSTTFHHAWTLVKENMETVSSLQSTEAWLNMVQTWVYGLKGSHVRRKDN